MTEAIMPNTESRLELMTFEQVAEALRRGCRDVIIPCGAIEQHGPHLPLCMDADHAEELAVIVAKRVGALVAPTIKAGCSAHHMSFAGTISLRAETLEAICQDYCVSLAQHGFARIFIFSAHIGNFPVLQEMLPRLRDSIAPASSVDAFYDSQAWLREWRAAVAVAGGAADKVAGHADIAETSLMMKLRPSSVRLERFEPGRVGMLTPEDLGSMWKNGIASVSRNGILGDPTGSSVEIGESCLEAIAALLVRSFEESRKETA